jgi:hypothetical protein
MRKTALAATLLALPAALLLGQSGVSPSNPGAVGIAKPNVPSPTPTRATGAAAFSAAAGQVKPPAQPLLHVEGRVTNLGCGKPLEFDIVVKNVAATPFAGGANLRIGGTALNRPPQLEGYVRAEVPAISARGSQTVHLTGSPVKVDCLVPRTFVVVLTPGVNLLQPHPRWDREAVELTTTPPTNCSATGGSSRLPHWDPRT